MIHHGDCLDVMAAMEPESVDAIVTDPPYGLEFMGKEWDRLRPAVGGRDDLRGAIKGERIAGGTFKERIGIRYGSPDKNPRCRKCYKLKHDHEKARCRCPEPRWDERRSEYGYANQWWHQEWAEAAYRVAKPSAYLLAFGGTRTVHRMTVALEDAGWIIRDMLVWAYASGFPKSKASLKPAWEPIVMARKPGPLRELAIDACRIPTDDGTARTNHAPRFDGTHYNNGQPYAPDDGDWQSGGNPAGRWPANVILTDPIFDGGWDGVVGGGEASFNVATPWRSDNSEDTDGWGNIGHRRAGDIRNAYGDSGTYSRYFLIPKADRADREPVLGGQVPTGDVFRGHQPDNPKCRTCGRQRIGPLGAPACQCKEPDWAPVGDRQRENTHPTVKPTELMRHLVRLVTPPGGTVLDPFAGSGSTLIAAEQEGFAWVGIEREEEYVRIAEARLNGTQRGLGLSA